jgi:hypothetical protein
MKHRKLRMAWSVMWGVVAVLLVAAWVRSYWRCDHAFGYLGPRYNFYANTQRGDFGLAVWNDTQNPGAPRFAVGTGPVTHDPVIAPFVRGPLATIGIRWLVSTGFVFAMPLWWPLMLVFTLLAVSWPSWSRRFSLRALLIATTLAAVGLGLIMTFGH